MTPSIARESIVEMRKLAIFCSDLSRFRRIHASLVNFLLCVFSEVPALLHMVLNPIHQFALRLSIGSGSIVDEVVLACFVDVVTECTLADFVGFVVSLWEIGEILLQSRVHPSALETVYPALPPKTRRVI